MSTTFFTTDDEVRTGVYVCQCVDFSDDERTPDPNCRDCKGVGFEVIRLPMHQVNCGSGRAERLLRIIGHDLPDDGITNFTPHLNQLQTLRHAAFEDEGDRAFATLLADLIGYALYTNQIINVA